MYLAIGIIAFMVGLLSILMKNKIADAFRYLNKQNGPDAYSEENIAGRIKLMKILGLIALVLGALMVVIELTGWVYM